MNRELILAKQQQAFQILKEKDIDMWITFVRETGNIIDPMMEMIVGTGATWHSAFILTKTGESIAIIGSLEEANMKTVDTFKTIKPYLKSINNDLIETIKHFDPNKIALNFAKDSTLADGLTHGMYLELCNILKNTPYVDRFISSEEIVMSLRGRKSEAEIEIMKKAAKETLAIYDEVTNYMKAGMTEKQIANFVLNLCSEKGYELAWDPEHCPAVFTGPESAGAHSGPTDRVIEKGHVVNLDFGVKINGYCSDLQRTWYMLKDDETEAPEEVLRGFRVIKESVHKAAEALKPGLEGWELDKISRDHIVNNGYSEYPHALGHQVGLAAHDGGGLLAPKWERYGNLPFLKIEEQQVYTIEPRLTIDGFGIATIEEEVVVTKNGCEFISEPQTELFLIKS